MLSGRSADDVNDAAASVSNAVTDVEEIARRAQRFNNANNWKRAAIEREEAEVVLRKARDQRERALSARAAALAVLAEAQAGPVVASETGGGAAQASERVQRIEAIIQRMDRDLAAIERTYATLQELDLPSNL